MNKIRLRKLRKKGQMLKFDFPRGTCFFPCTDEIDDPGTMETDEAIGTALALPYRTHYLPYEVLHGEEEVSLVLEVLQCVSGVNADIELPCTPAASLLESTEHLIEVQTTADYRMYLPEDEEILEHYKLLAAVTPNGNLFICSESIERMFPQEAAIPAARRVKATAHPIYLYCPHRYRVESGNLQRYLARCQVVRELGIKDTSVCPSCDARFAHHVMRCLSPVWCDACWLAMDSVTQEALLSMVQRCEFPSRPAGETLQLAGVSS